MTHENRPSCWIRGYMHPADYRNDAVRLATIECPHRVGGDNGFECAHPSAQPSEVKKTKTHGGVVYSIGGVDDFATFCRPVDMHLTSIGEPSRLVPTGEIIETTYRVVDDDPHLPLLPPPTK